MTGRYHYSDLALKTRSPNIRRAKQEKDIVSRLRSDYSGGVLYTRFRGTAHIHFKNYRKDGLSASPGQCVKTEGSQMKRAFQPKQYMKLIWTPANATTT